jgi:predicted deacetylase
VRAARLVFTAVLAVVCGVSAAGQQAPHDWQAQLRERIAAKEISAALAIAELRLKQAPQDLEARGWRARLLA